jgi:GNAT superfamily N-acetyltransferase
MSLGTDLVVRLGSSSDAAALASLRYRWRVEERQEGGQERGTFTSEFSSWQDAHRSSHIPFLALRNDAAIGMSWLALVDRVPSPGQFIRRSAYVQSTYVVEHERSTGVGTELVKQLVDHARELGLEYVAVHPSERAFSVYRRLGFEETSRVLELRFAPRDVSRLGSQPGSSSAGWQPGSR